MRGGWVPLAPPKAGAFFQSLVLPLAARRIVVFGHGLGALAISLSFSAPL